VAHLNGLARMKSGSFLKTLATVSFLAASLLRADTVLMASAVEMQDLADHIAIVEFQKAEPGTFKGPLRYPKQKDEITKRFHRRITARVIETLKGKLPGEIQIHDTSGLRDGLFQNHEDNAASPSGRYLVFLNGNPTFLTGSNGWASTYRIIGDEVEWCEVPESPKFQKVKLGEVVDRIRKQAARE
jgi:hypothetical protein